MDAEDAEYHSSYLGTDFVDVEWEFINGSVENPHIQQYLADAASNPHAKLTIAVCIPENNRAIAAAAYMPDSVYESNNTLQVLVYQRMNNDLLKQIGQNNKRYHNKLRAFGMATECYNSSLVTIAESMSNSLNDKYDSYCHNLVMEYYKKHGICEEDLHRLSPSYGKIAERSEVITDQFMEQIKAAKREILAELGSSYGDETGGTAISFMVVTLSAGQTLYGDAGCEVLLRSGRASCAAEGQGAPGLVDTTDGTSLNHGSALVQNHLYMMPGERGVLAQEDVVLLVRGDYTIESEGTIE